MKNKTFNPEAFLFQLRNSPRQERVQSAVNWPTLIEHEAEE